MKEALEKAVKEWAEKASNSTTSIEAQQFAQAALNAAHALATLHNMK